MAFSTRKLLLSFALTACLSFLMGSSFAQVGNALNFDGVNDRMTIGSDTALNLSTQLTIESWIKPEAGGNSVQTVISKSSIDQNNGYIFPRTNDNWGNLVFYLNFNAIGWDGLEVPYTGSIGSWTHVAATYDGAFMRIYINGNLAGEKAVVGTITVNTNPLTVGYHNGFEGIESEYYKGSIDEIRIWRRSLTQCEIQNNRTCELPAGGQSGLVSYFKLNQGLAGLLNNLLTGVTNSVTGAANATLSNFGLTGLTSNWVEGIASGTCAVFAQPVVTVTSDQPSYLTGSIIQLNATGGVSYSWTGPNGFTSTDASPVLTAAANRAGVYTATVTTASGCQIQGSVSIQVTSSAARALNFDGVNDVVSIPNSASLNTGTGLTIEAWIYPTDKQTPIQTVLNKSTFGSQGYVFPRTDDGWRSVSFYVHLEGQGWKIARAAYPLVGGEADINKWHHVAATYDGFKLRIYIDGVLSATEEFVGTISRNTNPISIGNQPGYTEYYRGSVDEVRIWDRALDRCEISNNMSCQLPMPQTGLAAYYQFNQGLQNVNNAGVTTLTDASGNNNNGVLQNFSLLTSTSNWTTGRVSNVTCAPFAAPTVTATINGPVLEVGNNIVLTASAPGATSYSWTGPNNFTSNQQNPIISNAQIINTGTYIVTADAEGCTPLASVSITIANKAGTLDLDGVNDVLTRPSNSSLNIREEITMEAWIHPTNGQAQIQSVMGKSSRTNNTSYIFPRTDDGWNSLTFYLHIDGQWKILTATGFNGLNKWSHVAATYDGYHMRIYVDGLLKATQEVSGKITQNENSFAIGNQPGYTEFYRGKIEEAKVWSRALNQCEVINNMNCELQPAQTGLVAYYKFNQGWANIANAETSVVDASNNNNHLTMHDFAQAGTTSNWTDFKVNGTCSTYAEPPVTAQANGSIFGIGSTIRLFANGGSAYTWSGPNGFSSNSPGPILYNAQTIYSGTYTVAVPFVKCEIFKSVRLTVTNLPAIQASGNTTICPSSTVQLSIATAGTTYQWFLNGEAIQGATTATYQAGQSGEYHVAVTTENEESVSAPITITVIDNVAPSPNVASLPVLELTAPATVTTKPTAIDNCAGTIVATTTSPLTFTQAGTYTIVWKYNDGNGNETTQQQQVVVTGSVDVTPPVIVVPTNIVKANDLNVCGAVATFAATATDDQTSATITYSHASGSVFPVGTTTVTVTAVDEAGNTATATFTITVNDTQAPVLTVPADINSTSTTGINVGTATATDNCGQVVVTSTTIPTVFPLGVTQITWTATDAAGNTSTGVQKVTVTDNQAPTLVGVPANTVANCGILPSVPTVTATDNFDPNPTVTFTTATNGNTVTRTWTATDASGNTVSATQVITVVMPVAPIITGPVSGSTVTANPLAAALNFNIFAQQGVTLGGGQSHGPIAMGGNLTIAGDHSVSNNSAGSFKVQNVPVTLLTGGRVVYQSGNNVNVNQNGYVKIAEANGSVAWYKDQNNAFSPIRITPGSNYNGSPRINLQANSQQLGVSATNNPVFEGGLIDFAAAFQQLKNSSTSLSQLTANANLTNANGATIPHTNLPNQVKINLANGVNVLNISGANLNAVQNFTYNNAPSASRILVVNVNAPGSFSWNVWNSGGIGDQNTKYILYNFYNTTSLTIQGNGSVMGSILAPFATVNKSVSQNITGQIVGQTFTHGSGTNTYNTFDGTITSGSSSVIAAGSNNVRSTSNGCVYVINGNEFNATAASADNCGIPTMTYVLSGATTGSGGNLAGVSLNAGVTTVTWTATVGNLSTSYSFTVTVSDNQAPVVVTKNITVELDANGQATILPTAVDNGSVDNCNIVEFTLNKVSFNASNLGANTVTVTAKDAAGNVGTGTAIVTVIDVIPPVITSVAPISRSNDAGACGAVVTYAATTVTDNSGSVASVTYSHPSGSVFPVGTTTVTITAKDASNNTSTRTFTVTVADVQAPQVSVPANITVDAAANTCGANVTFSAAATDNCGVANVSYSHNSGSLFPVGTTTVTVTATDVNGNTATATFTVTVKDVQAPQLTVPANITANNTTNTCGANVSFTASASDNCGGVVNVSFSHVSGSQFPVGTTTVTVTATDASGNTTTRSFNVTVVDVQAPSITAPANVNVISGSPVTLGNATASDNCGNVTITNNAPASYPVGVTVVTWRATDAAGNTATATQTVTVTMAPAVCTSSITVVPENNTYTGGVPSNIYLGYGPQKVTLKAAGTGGTSYTYSWTSVSGGGSLNSSSSSQPVFAPTKAGNYTFRVTVRTQSGCVSTSTVTICVKDIRVKDEDDDRCDHKAHNSKTCKHGKHNHGKCDHKSHDKKKCKDKYDDGDDDNDECDHKPHDKKNCKHKGHRHNNCDHKSHNSRSCKNKYDDHDDDDHDDDDDDDNYKVYLCHAPSGNSSNQQTLKISVNAVASHLENHPGDRLGSCSDQGCVVVPPPPVCTSEITVVPENTTYTGGVPNNIYLGYGPQKVTLQVSVTGGSGYTYSWKSISGGGTLSNTSSAQPVFSPSNEGYYTFEVKVTSQSGCTTTSQVSICVQDVRVEEDCYDLSWSSLLAWYFGYSSISSSNPSKVYITRRNGNSNNYSVMEVKTADVAAHLQRYPNDRLGKGLNGCVSNAVSSNVLGNVTTVTPEVVTVDNGKIVTQPRTESDLEIKVMGNPSRSYFTVKIESKHDLPVQVRMFDMNGRTVESKANQLPNSTIQLGHNLGTGTYYAEFVQGTSRKTVQLIKVR